ncbi:MAG: hypothetical protein J6334_07370, partial [Kiritimatiellae bacterium]|nr:hypothetical protein [Kiritimatiellia bacterium]
TGDVVIESFGPLDRGRFECVVRIEGVGVRKGAVSAETFGANVGKVLVFEGAETLDPDTFTVDAVETALGIPKDGKGVFTLWPKDPVRSFFVRARVK